MKLGLTGYTGFIGGALKGALSPTSLTLLGRRRPACVRSFEEFQPFELNEPQTAHELDLRGLDCIIHCAGIAKEPAGDEDGIMAFYKRVNSEAAVALARQAAADGVQRYVFLSSVKVFGERMESDTPFTEQSATNPEGPYARSKLHAENALLELSQESDMEVVIIRLPLVYGQGVKGNFAKLGQAVAKGWPLPLADATNTRSMLGIHNAVDFIKALVWHEHTLSGVLLVTDDTDYSVAYLTRQLAEGQGKRARLLHVPRSIMFALCRVAGKSMLYERLFSPFVVDAQRSRSRLGWQSAYTLQDELAFMYSRTA